MWRGGSKVAVVVLTGSAFLFSACGDSAQLPLSAGFGPDPQLPPPNVTLLPTVNIAPAVGWHAGEQPTPAPGLAITAFAMGLNHPATFTYLHGDVLVAETRRSAETEIDNLGPGSRDNPMGYGPRWRGPDSANRLVLLRDTHKSGAGRYAIGLPRRAGLAVRHGSDR